MKAFHFKLRRLFAQLIGLVFFVSGTLKLIDPVGTELIVSEYLKFFHMNFLQGGSFFIGALLSLVEGFVGLALLTGVFRKVAAYTAGTMIVFFTFVTALLLIYNPDMDCGCFGKAFALTHFQSFAKNVLLLAMAVIAFLPFKDYGKPAPRKYVAFGFSAIGMVVALVYCAMYLPLHDHTAFKPGAFVMDAEEAAASAPAPRYVFEKDGKEKTFDMDDLPDSTWSFVTILEPLPHIRKTEPAVLEFTDSSGEYCSALAREGGVMVFSAYRPEKLDAKWWEQVAGFRDILLHHSIRPLVLVAGVPADLPVPASLQDCVYTADFKTLVTMNRSNGGMTYLYDASVIRKWARRSPPDEMDLAVLVSEDPLDVSVSSSTSGRLRIQGFYLYELIWLLLL